MNKRVVIEQSEIISPLGKLTETVCDLIEGASAIVQGPCFDVPVAYAPFNNIQFRDLEYCTGKIGSSIDMSTINLSSTLFIYCAAKGDIRYIDNKISSNQVKTDTPPLLDLQAEIICKILDIKPAAKLVISNACASGAIGIETAVEVLTIGRYSDVILFGFDCLSRFTTTGFYALSALSKSGARPFDAKRDGLTLGEGAAIAVLSNREAHEGDIIITGTGSSNDANHRTGPSRTGEGLFNAANSALLDASIRPDSIGAVKCHGTATEYNDAMEAKAIHKLFNDKCPPCSSFKGSIGHLSGAGSLIEILITAECIKRSTLPPTKGYENHGVDEQISISSKPQPIKKPSVLCLSAGFGGLNAAIIVAEHK